MSRSLGPIQIECDTPPFAIVDACARLEFQSPWDVRWCRLSDFLSTHQRAHRRFGFHPLRWLFGAQAPRITCSCGRPLPRMERCTFTFESQEQAQYLLGQCAGCRTIFWDEAHRTTKSGPRSSGSGLACS